MMVTGLLADIPPGAMCRKAKSMLYPLRAPQAPAGTAREAFWNPRAPRVPWEPSISVLGFLSTSRVTSSGFSGRTVFPIGTPGEVPESDAKSQ